MPARRELGRVAGTIVVCACVLVYSGGLAVYYLFLNPATRLVRPRAAAADLSPTLAAATPRDR